MDRSIGRLNRPFAFSGSILAALCLTIGLSAGCGRSSSGGSPPASPGSPTPTPVSGSADQAGPGSLDIALYVEEYAGVDRNAEPVRSGVPVPRGVGLTDASTLQVVGPDGSVVPSQIAVTSRWEGGPDDATKPIKWLLVDFPADVPASGSVTYRLRTMPAPSSAAPAALVTADASDHLEIDTGAAHFVIQKTGFDLFHQVTLADGTVVSQADTSSGPFLVDRNGNRFQAAATQVTVEENGPLHVVVLARGKHAGPSGQLLDLTVRMHFWKGRSDSLVAYTFTEKDLPSIYSYDGLSEAGISLPVTPGAAPRYAFGSEQGAVAGSLSGEAWQEETGALDEAMGANFNPGDASTIVWKAGGAAQGSGGHAPGWVDLSGSTGGVTAAVRWFWQQYPKKLDVTPNRMTVDLWPSDAVGMRVYAAAQKTHEVLFTFHDARTDGQTVGQASAARLAEPLMARCNPTWYAQSWVWNRLGVADPKAYLPENQALVAEYFDHIESTEFPQTFVDRRFNASGRGHEYSMWDFGDSREDSWSNAAYDTPRALTIDWAITGRREFLDRAFEVASYLRDVGIEHSPLDTRSGVTPNRGVAEPWLGRTRYNPTKGPQAHDLGYPGATTYGFEHIKGQGLADHFFITGDRESKDVLAETYHYFNQWKVDADSGYLRTDGTRVVSHMLLILLGYYDAFGTQEARDRIDFTVQYLNAWQRQKTAMDPNGWMWMDISDTTSGFMNGVTGESLMLYEVAVPDGIPVRQNIIDAAKWTADPTRGILVNASQGPYLNAWSDNNYGINHATILEAMSVAYLAYGADATGDAAQLDLTKQLLEDYMHQDGSAPLMKSYTQQTRLVPAFLYFLQTGPNRQEAGAAGLPPSS